MSDLDEELFTEETIPSAKTKRGGDIFETTKGSAKPAKPKQKRNRSEESHKEMCDRLAKARIKAYETRIANKKRREEEKAEKEKTVQRVEKFIANPEDIFEKKYADKFCQLTDMISGVAADVNDMKEMKRKKREQKEHEAKLKEQQAKEQQDKEQQAAKEQEPKTNEAHLTQPPKPEQSSKPATDIKQPKQPMRASDIMQQMSYTGTYNKYSRTRKF
jgi:hypothetical protein